MLYTTQADEIASIHQRLSDTHEQTGESELIKFIKPNQVQVGDEDTISYQELDDIYRECYGVNWKFDEEARLLLADYNIYKNKDGLACALDHFGSRQLPKLKEVVINFINSSYDNKVVDFIEDNFPNGVVNFTYSCPNREGCDLDVIEFQLLVGFSGKQSSTLKFTNVNSDNSFHFNHMFHTAISSFDHLWLNSISINFDLDMIQLNPDHYYSLKKFSLTDYSCQNPDLLFDYFAKFVKEMGKTNLKEDLQAISPDIGVNCISKEKMIEVVVQAGFDESILRS
jgi:hypothetical protein